MSSIPSLTGPDGSERASLEEMPPELLGLIFRSLSPRSLARMATMKPFTMTAMRLLSKCTERPNLWSCIDSHVIFHAGRVAFLARQLMEILPIQEEECEPLHHPPAPPRLPKELIINFSCTTCTYDWEADQWHISLATPSGQPTRTFQVFGDLLLSITDSSVHLWNLRDFSCPFNVMDISIAGAFLCNCWLIYVENAVDDNQSTLHSLHLLQPANHLSILSPKGSLACCLAYHQDGYAIAFSNHMIYWAFLTQPAATFFHTVPITAMVFFNQQLVVGDIEGKITFYSHSGISTKQYAAHQSPIAELSSTNDFFVSRDEGNHFIYWTDDSHHPIDFSRAEEDEVITHTCSGNQLYVSSDSSIFRLTPETEAQDAVLISDRPFFDESGIGRFDNTTSALAIHSNWTCFGCEDGSIMLSQRKTTPISDVFQFKHVAETPEQSSQLQSRDHAHQHPATERAVLS